MEIGYPIIGAILLIMFITIISQSNKISGIEAKLKHTEFLLQEIAKQVGVPEHPVNEELRQLVRNGKCVEAVKKARETFGYSLVEATKYVDGL